MSGDPSHGPGDPVDAAAARWVVRSDRGLSPAEQDELMAWLAADPRHRRAWADHQRGWEELDRIAGLHASAAAGPDPELRARAAQTRSPGGARQGRGVVLALVATAAAIGFLLLRPWAPETARADGTAPGVPAVRRLAPIETRALPDGSRVLLNRDARLAERFGATERRIVLEAGEAFFTVQPDAARPFVVEAGDVVVRAVGTAFNVKLEPAAVEVLVTEGKVGVGRTPGPGAEASEGVTLVAAGERAFAPRAAPAPVVRVNAPSPEEIAARLGWQPAAFDFTEAPLPEILAAFNRRNPVQLTLAEPLREPVRLSLAFRSDHVQGFVRLLVSEFGFRAEWRGENEIVLSPPAGRR